MLIEARSIRFYDAMGLVIGGRVILNGEAGGFNRCFFSISDARVLAGSAVLKHPSGMFVQASNRCLADGNTDLKFAGVRTSAQLKIFTCNPWRWFSLKLRTAGNVS